MLWKSLAVSLMAVSCVSAPTKKQIVSFSADRNKPYRTLVEHCGYDEMTDTAVCKGAGFRRALTESAQLAKTVVRLERENEALAEHSKLDSWFYEGQMNEEKRKRQQAEVDRWYWGGTGIAVGIISTVLTILFAN